MKKNRLITLLMAGAILIGTLGSGSLTASAADAYGNYLTETDLYGKTISELSDMNLQIGREGHNIYTTQEDIDAAVAYADEYVNQVYGDVLTYTGSLDEYNNAWNEAYERKLDELKPYRNVPYGEYREKDHQLILAEMRRLNLLANEAYESGNNTATASFSTDDTTTTNDTATVDSTTTTDNTAEETEAEVVEKTPSTGGTDVNDAIDEKLAKIDLNADDEVVAKNEVTSAKTDIVEDEEDVSIIRQVTTFFTDSFMQITTWFSNFMVSIRNVFTGK